MVKNIVKSRSQLERKPLHVSRQAPASRRPPIMALTGMRSALILWIVLYHLQPELAILLPSAPLLNLAATGFAGVDFFFITSGFIIAYNYATRLSPFSLANYRRFLWLRLARIYPVHLFSLLLVLLMFCAAKIMGSALSNPEFYTWPSLIQNLFLVQAWTLPTTFSWNAVAWAVSNEWMAYLAFPIIIAITLRIRSVSATISCILLLLWGMTAICLLLDATWQTPYGAGGYGLIRAAGEFTAGCLLYNLYMAQWGKQWGAQLRKQSGEQWRTQQKNKQWPIGTLTNIAWAAAIVGSMAIAAHGLRSNASDNIQGFQLQVLWLTPLYALAIYMLSWQRGAIANLFKTKLLIAGGEMSYALYLTHFIVLIVLRRALPIENMASVNIMLRLSILLGYLAVMGIVAIMTYRLIEEPGRMWMRNWLSKPSRQPDIAIAMNDVKTRQRHR